MKKMAEKKTEKLLMCSLCGKLRQKKDIKINTYDVNGNPYIECKFCVFERKISYFIKATLITVLLINLFLIINFITTFWHQFIIDYSGIALTITITFFIITIVLYLLWKYKKLIKLKINFGLKIKDDQTTKT